MTLVRTTYNRRSFLKASAATGGGMVLGFSWLASCSPTAEEILAMPDEWFNINAFLKIGENGVVTVMSPNPEIGQGVKTAMPMIVAEELDVDWNKVFVNQAGLDTDLYSRQVAGGSQSIRQGWEPLRMAGATARRMLMQAASEQLAVPVDELTTSSGVITHAPTNQSLGYGEVASLASQLQVPEEVTLKDPSDFKIIGTRVPNVDGMDIVMGKPLYGSDLQKENMLIATIIHPPAFGLTIESIDDSAARSMPGVQDIFIIDAQPEGVELNWSDTNAFPQLVAVVANSTWEAIKAKNAVDVTWSEVTAPENSQQHDQALGTLVASPAEEPSRVDGNPTDVFANASKVIERSYSAPFLAHNTMEPMNFFADVTDDAVVLEGPIQTPESLRGTVSKLLAIDESKISVMLTRMGGGFGRRLYGNFGVEAALVSKQMGRPIKLVYTREDDMTQGTYRPAYQVVYRAAVDDQNNIVGFHVRGAGADGSPVFPDRFPAGTIDNYLAERKRQTTNVSTGAWRAPRSNFIAFAEQSFLDELAEETGRDPIEMRLELFERALNNPVGEENDYDPERYAGVLKLVRAESGWGKDTPGLHRGVSAYYCHNSYVAQVVDVKMENDKPIIEKVWCAVDCGIVVNMEGALNQIEGGIIDGIGHAMYSAMTFTDGRPDQQNFDKYRLIRNSEAPREIAISFVESDIDPTGLGEPSLPPVAAALANAMYKATGERLYNQPFAQDKPILG